MSQGLPFPLSREEVSARYRVRLLDAPEVTEGGVVHRQNGERCVLEWGRVRRALAAEVGEPQGVRTIVFDLVLELDDSGCEVARLDAEPGDAAVEVARAIAEGVGPGCHAASIKSLAADGLPSHWYPDLEALDEAALDILATA